MKPKPKSKSRVIAPGGVDEYIAQFPKEVQTRLKEIRIAARAAAPGSTETVSYFEMPGYCYECYDYNGMFAWFSFKAPYVRLHVRPPVLKNHKKEIADYPTTSAIISFPMDKPIPMALVKMLVKASITVMKQK